MSDRNASGHLPRRAVALGAFLALALATVFTGGPVSAQDAPSVSPEERAAALLRPAVVYIETFWAGFVYDEDSVYFNDGNAFEFSTSCTGFVVNPAGTIMTAGHCVDDSASFGGIKRDLIEIAAQEAFDAGTYEGAPGVEELFEFGLANWTVEGPAKGSPVQREVFVQRGRAASGERTGEALPARVVDFRSAESGDVAVLKVEASDLPSVIVSEVNELEIGTPLLSVGYPGLTKGAVDESLEPTNKDGKISAKKTQGSFPVYEVSAAIASGMSGGPTVNLEGEVIGVNSFGIGDSEAFNFIVPASNVREILARNGTKNELGRIDTIYREGLAAFYAGRFTPAIAAFDRALDLDPAHQQAQEYRQDAAKARAEGGEVGEGEEGKFPIVPVAVGAVVVLGLIGAAVAMKGRKKPQGELPAAGGTAGPAYQPPSSGPAYDAPQPPTTPIETAQPSASAATHVPPAPVAPAPVSSAPPAPSPSPVSPPPPSETSAPASPSAAASAPADSQSTDSAGRDGESASKPKFCPSCGTARATETTQFCGGCGTKF